MEHLHAGQALLPEGWASDVALALSGGRIVSVATGQPPAPGARRVACLIPGLPNLHSHAFQRGFAGLAERRGPGDDTFWTWRETMYRLALSLSPEAAEAVAALAFAEMLEGGFTRVGEFHYLHHAPDGRPYEDPAEMAGRIVAAAQGTGIALTLLPVFYAHANFGGLPPTPGQRRFLNDPDGFARLMEAARGHLARPQDRIGLAPHSLRAVTEAELTALLAAHPEGPVHIHVAEQEREVADSLAFSGQRPVDWLLDHAPVGPDWCLIHATHLTAAEVARLAATGAVAGLCPVTEANLGDGIFPGPEFAAQGGRFGLGTDSNVRIGAAEEMRALEYAQRLRARQRNLMTAPGQSTGRGLFEAALAGGTQALAAPEARIAAGAPADLVALRDRLGLPAEGDAMLDRWIFGADVAVDRVWAHGALVVDGGRHVARDRIEAAFRPVLAALLSA